MPSPLLVLGLTAALFAAGEPATRVTYATLDGQAPIVIAHRGASGQLPEHTLEAYRRAIEQGADFIEPDLVLTADRQLIARHEPMLDGTTDVATKFPASRRTTRQVDGMATTAYFANDFTLAEIKTLRAVQARPARSQAFNGQFQIPTLDEVIALARKESERRSRRIGIYPELKHSTFMASLVGEHVFEDLLLTTLHAAFGNRKDAPVFIQSFEVSNLRYLRGKTRLPLMQLIDADGVNDDGSVTLVAPSRQPYDFIAQGDTRTFANLLSDDGLDFIKTYADAIGPWKPYLVKTVADGVERDGQLGLTAADRRVIGDTGVIARAHARGLRVHAWAFRDDDVGFGFADATRELDYYLRLGVDGVFTDFPATGVAAVKAL